MNPLAQSRETIRAALADAGITAYKYVPATVPGTCAVIQPGTPFIEDTDQPYDDYEVTWLVSLIIQTGTNERVTEELDALIFQVLTVLEVSDVTQPFEFSDHGASYLAANLTVTDNITIKE